MQLPKIFKNSKIKRILGQNTKKLRALRELSKLSVQQLRTLNDLLKSRPLNPEDARKFNLESNFDWISLQTLVKSKCESAVICFSQTGEDMVLRSFFRDKSNGYFIDIGANHPSRFSNTYYFYTKGWQGINLDPTPGSMKAFDELRPKDINLEIATGNSGRKTFYVFEETCHNTFDETIANSLIANKISALVKAIPIAKVRLDDILDSNLPMETSIDFLTIDAEGLDLEILKTNNWEKYRPNYICAECHTKDSNRPMNPKVFIKTQGYELVAKTEFSEIYKCE